MWKPRHVLEMFAPQTCLGTHLSSSNERIADSEIVQGSNGVRGRDVWKIGSAVSLCRGGGNRQVGVRYFIYEVGCMAGRIEALMTLCATCEDKYVPKQIYLST